MQVRAVVSFASMVKGDMQPWPVGRVAELPEPEGLGWLRLGWVVPVEAEPEPEPAEAESESEPAAADKPAAKKRAAKKAS